MNLTGEQIRELSYIFGCLEADNIQQHSIDLNLVEVQSVKGDGFIPNDTEPKQKTKLAERKIVQPIRNSSVWYLTPGWYEIFFAQGCLIPSNQRMRILHRSSLYRNGSQINSSLFDAGFKTLRIGTHMHVTVPIWIEVNARIATALFEQSNEVKNLYNGQWQGK